MAPNQAVLGEILLLQSRYREAETILRSCLTIRNKKIPDQWQRFNAMSLLGDALLRLGKYPEAEPLLLQGYEGLKQRESKIPHPAHHNLPNARTRIVRLYESMNQPEKADIRRKKVELELAPYPRIAPELGPYPRLMNPEKS